MSAAVSSYLDQTIADDDLQNIFAQMLKVSDAVCKHCKAVSGVFTLGKCRCGGRIICHNCTVESSKGRLTCEQCGESICLVNGLEAIRYVNDLNKGSISNASLKTRERYAMKVPIFMVPTSPEFLKGLKQPVVHPLFKIAAAEVYDNITRKEKIEATRNAELINYLPVLTEPPSGMTASEEYLNLNQLDERKWLRRQKVSQEWIEDPVSKYLLKFYEIVTSFIMGVLLLVGGPEAVEKFVRQVLQLNKSISKSENGE